MGGLSENRRQMATYAYACENVIRQNVFAGYSENSISETNRRTMESFL
jgi:hypothetical protein